MAIALTQPITLEDESFDFGCSEYFCPPRMPGLIVRGKTRASNAIWRRLPGDEGTAPCVLVDWGIRAHLISMVAHNGQFGYQLDHSEYTRIIDCEADGSDLDGGKERVGNFGTLWERGFYCRNGRNPNAKGDGIDSYAGGRGTTYSNVVADDNDGCGIVFKTAPVTNGTGTPASGYQCDVEVIHCKARRNLFGMSLEAQQETALTQYSAVDHAPRPMAGRIHIAGGIYNENAWDGINCWARDWTAVGVQTNFNRRAGFKVGRTARDWALVAPMAIGNGRTPLLSNVDAPAGSAGKRAPNIWVCGKRGVIIAPVLRGRHSQDAWTDAEMDAAEITARDGIWFSADADDVDVQSPIATGHLRAAIRRDTAGTIRLNGQVVV